MPKVKYKEFLEKLEKAGAFNFRSVQGTVGRGYAKVFLHNLRKQGKIIELMRGWYSFRKSPYLIVIPLGEAYIGLGTAAFLHNAWDQVPNIDVLTPRAPVRIRAGERVIGGRKVLIRRIDKKMYFGYESTYIEGAGRIRVSDPEKTLIDLLYCNYPFCDEIIPRLLEKISKEKLLSYTSRVQGLRGGKKIRKAVRSWLALYKREPLTASGSTPGRSRSRQPE